MTNFRQIDRSLANSRLYGVRDPDLFFTAGYAN